MKNSVKQYLKALLVALVVNSKLFFLSAAMLVVSEALFLFIKQNWRDDVIFGPGIVPEYLSVDGALGLAAQLAAGAALVGLAGYLLLSLVLAFFIGTEITDEADVEDRLN